MLAYVWSRPDYLGYGYLVPASALVLLWVRRGEVARAVRNGAPPAGGALWVLGAALVEAFGLLADVGSLAGLGIPLVLLCTAYAVAGRSLASALALPVGFLAFMVPPPAFAIGPLLDGLKAVVTEVSVFLLQAAGLLVASEGNQILVPGHVLFVADACSGLTSIVTLLPLSVVIATFFLSGTLRRISLVASVVPLAVLGNIVRVTVTVILVSRFGLEYAEGNLHETFGVLTFALGAVALLAVARLLR